jgi:hypothetical protein
MLERFVVAVLLLSAWVLPAHAERVVLRSGKVLEGRVVSREGDQVVLEIGIGRMAVPRSLVAKVEPSRSPLQSFEERSRCLEAGDLGGWRGLARWAESAGLHTRAREAWTQVARIDPDDGEAQAFLGRVRLGDRWVTVDERLQALGYVRYEGEWLPPEEVAQRRQREEAEVQRAVRLREALARARAAEAEARRAEALAAAASGQSWAPAELWIAPPGFASLFPAGLSPRPVRRAPGASPPASRPRPPRHVPSPAPPPAAASHHGTLVQRSPE